MAGVAGTDKVSLGGWNIEDQPIQLADSISPVFIQSTGDGVLGLGFGSPGGSKRTPVQSIIAQNTTIPKSEQVFAIKLGSSKGLSRLNFPFVSFGSADGSVGKGVSYTPVKHDKGLWEFESSTTTVNEVKLELPGSHAVADTGTALSLIHDTACAAIYDSIPGATYDYENQGYIFPSSVRDEELPSVKFAVGEKLFTVRKEYLRFADAENKPGYVYGGIQSRGKLAFNVFGGSFLKSIIAVRFSISSIPSIVFSDSYF